MSRILLSSLRQVQPKLHLSPRMFSSSPASTASGSQPSSSPSSPVFKRVTVIGSGLMGSGIAQVTAEAGYRVTLVDTQADQLAKAMKSIKANLARTVKKKFEKEPDASKAESYLNATLGRISTTSELHGGGAEGADQADLIVEAIIENMKIKHELFSKLDKAAPATSIFASNTSSLPIGEIAECVSAERRARFGGLHFFNPVPVMKLLEVIRLPDTSDETYATLLAFGKSIGKTTVECKDTPGFIVNRLLVPYLFEAIRMVERGDASFQDVDTAMKLGASHPMGPFELSDYVGLDLCKFIMEGWARKYPDNPQFKESQLLNKYVAEGKLGRKSGQGFYNYAPAKK